MNTKTIAFFNCKKGVGKTSLVYHLAWMYDELGYRVVAADLDPQANLSIMFLGDDRLEELWLQNSTISDSLQPIIQGLDDISAPHLELVTDQLALLTGDIKLLQFESFLTEFWSTSLYSQDNLWLARLQAQDNHRRKLAFQLISALWKTMQKAATEHEAHFILIDLAPTLGAINLAALIAADYIIVPMFLDFFALQALSSLGMALQTWKKQWQVVLEQKHLLTDIELPFGKMEPIGYVMLRPVVRFDRPVKLYQDLLTRLPIDYQEKILNKPTNGNISIANDPNCLDILKNYVGLMSMAQEAGKPMFHLKPADGALGSYLKAAKDVYKEFASLANAIAQRTQA
ncbi:MAG: ParA family protein [Scytonema sp. PMC 1069.18]|nr:ParA family protein [Scytonema sp. PMC 1069.18]MEC4886495.1 ParA family protein [Scytonema sp. PMC 1070.18]